MAKKQIEGHDPYLHGVAAEFSDPDVLLAAAERARTAGYTVMDAYTPFPVHGLDDAIGFREAKVQWSIFLAGLIGACAGLGLQYYTSVIDYPLNIGGRPLFSWTSFIPVTYECTILFAGITAFLSVLVFNGLPRPNHPVFNAPRFELASQDAFFLCIEAEDPKFDLKETEKFMKTLGADAVSVVRGDETQAEADGEGGH